MGRINNNEMKLKRMLIKHRLENATVAQPLVDVASEEVDTSAAKDKAT